MGNILDCSSYEWMRPYRSPPGANAYLCCLSDQDDGKTSNDYDAKASYPCAYTDIYS